MRERLNYGRTFVIGLGFFTTSISWSLFNSYVPIFLRGFLSSSALIGFVMTLDNWSAILIQPWIGALSDRTSTRLGRRLPFVAAGVPIAAIFFAAIPVLAARGTADVAPPGMASGLLPLFGVIMGFNLAMALYRAPVVALMPDLTPSVHRSAANGIINLMGGVGSILAFLGGSYLYEAGKALPFFVTSGVMVVAALVLLLVIREGKTMVSAAQEKPAILRSLKGLFGQRDKTGLFILGAILFWFLGHNGVETWFTTYGVEVLGIGEASASRMVTAVAASFVVFALPAGYLGRALGRKRTILLGLGVYVLVVAAMIVVRATWAIWALMGMAGLAWALINVNSITVVWELAKGGSIGTFTGLYYFASASAQILSPPLLGLLFDAAGVRAMFPAVLVLFLIAAALMLGVRSGEAQETKTPA